VFHVRDPAAWPAGELQVYILLFIQFDPSHVYQPAQEYLQELASPDGL
jgi:hypothetical protein